jgi:hypothetical protein
MANIQFEKFIEELNALQDKYDIYIHPEYEEEIDYTWEEESYVSGVNVYFAYYDSEGERIG